MESKPPTKEQKEISLFLKKLLTHEKSLHKLMKRQSKFHLFHENDQAKVEVYFYQLSRDRQPLFGFLFSEFWGKETEFLVRKQAESHKSDWKESLKMIFIRKMLVQLDTFLTYICFYQWLVSEISLIPPHKIRQNTVAIEEIFEYNSAKPIEIEKAIYMSRYSELLKILKQPLVSSQNSETNDLDENAALLFKRISKTPSKSPKKRPKDSKNFSFIYLILPLLQTNQFNWGINHQKITGYLNFLLTLETPSASQRTSILKRDSLIKAIYGGKACYIVSSVVESPKTETVQDFLERLLKVFPKYSMRHLLDYFELTQSEASRSTFDAFLHSGKSTRSNISKYRDVSETCGIEYSRSDPVYILRTMVGFRSFRFEGEGSFQSQDLGVKIKNLNLILLSCAHVKKHFLSPAEIKTWMELPFLLNSFHLNWQSRHFWKTFSGAPSTDLFLQQSLAIKAFNPKFNLETLETLGDSVLKFAVSIYLFWRFEEINENQLTELRLTFFFVNSQVQISQQFVLVPRFEEVEPKRTHQK